MILLPALLAMLIGAMPPRSVRPRPYVGARAMVAAHLDDYTWRRQETALWLDRLAWQRWRDDAAIAAVHNPLNALHPLRPRERRGVDVIRQWWTPDPVAPIDRRTPGRAWRELVAA